MKVRAPLLAILFLLLAAIGWPAPRPWEPAEAPPAVVAESGGSSPLRERIGVNVLFANNPGDIAAVAGWARDYHRWYWYEPQRGRPIWDNDRQRLDQFYSGLNRLDVKLLASVEMVPPWASSNGRTSGLPRPRDAAGDRPEDYSAHAEYLAQLAARYGSTHQEEGLRSQDGKSGLGWVQAMEGWNEPNQSWAEPRFPPAQFARLLEEDYDCAGAARQPGMPLVGIKQGDPKMLALFPGLAGPDVSYLDRTVAGRSVAGQLPFDILSFHWYAKGDDQGGRSPEAAGLVASLAAVRRWRDGAAPGRLIWLTEIGWDTNSRVEGGHSPLYAPEESAAAYLVRAVMLSLANGADKLFVFTYRDDDSESPQLYSTAGLVENSSAREGEDGRKKAGWYYLATLSQLLGKMILRGVDRQGQGDPAVYQYRLEEPGGSAGAVVAWVRNPRSPRDDGTRVRGYRLSLPGAGRAERVELVPGSTLGARSGLTLREPGSPSAGATLTLSETPVIVLYQRQ